MKPRKRGNTSAGALLVISIVLLIAFLAYISSPGEMHAKEQKTYFQNLDFTLAAGKMWRVGVPIAFDGTLHLSFMSNDTARFYAKEQGRYLYDSLGGGRKDYFIKVTASMGIIEVALTNPDTINTIQISGLTCLLVP